MKDFEAVQKSIMTELVSFLLCEIEGHIVNKSFVKQPLLCVVMDGVGITKRRLGNALAFSHMPNLERMRRAPLSCQLKAHGKAVGLPSDADMGNSEVGHNALGAGQIYDQGAKLVQNAIADGSLESGQTWQALVGYLKETGGTLHFIGLLSDGNVHSHEQHLYALIKLGLKAGIKKQRLHVLLDGRDVGEKSAEVYIGRLREQLELAKQAGGDVRVASGGGRMYVTMDRYEADWLIVERGWRAHVLGEAKNYFSSVEQAVQTFREDPKMTDQWFPPFVITENSIPVGTIQDGDAVVMLNFRGDRAIEISRAFTDKEFSKFTRMRQPKIFYAGMMQYDGDLKIPEKFLVNPPLIANTMGQFLAQHDVRQFACSETQKFGHVTYFWNGNRSGKFDDKTETYAEIPSDLLSFDLKPWMKAYEITEAAIAAMHSKSFHFGRINYANGDMVGHTGNFAAAVTAVNTVDLMLGRLMVAAQENGYTLVVTADHGNCDEMLELSGKEADDIPVDDWKKFKPKTSHTLNPVPFVVHNHPALDHLSLADIAEPGLGNVAATCLTLMGVKNIPDIYLPSLVKGSF